MTGVTLAFVVPWFGDEVRGGAELQGWETARELSRRGCRVEILTTCSRSFLHRWDENHHAPGVSEREGITVRRFAVDRRDEGRFAAANGPLLSGGARERGARGGLRPREHQQQRAVPLHRASTPSAISSSSRPTSTGRRSPAPPCAPTAAC